MLPTVSTASLTTSGGGIGERLELVGTYDAECYGPDGELKWSGPDR